MTNLTQAKITEISARYELEPTDKLVIESVAQANENHGKPGTTPWATRDGKYVAELLLDGYLAEETRSMRCDAKAVKRFYMDAYGE